MDEIIITEIGLLLSQMRLARRALEDIERSTARYGGGTFAVALAAGPQFGEPPLLSGALKVYVTNLNELTVSRGAGLLESILGGFGRFMGGLTGGFIGGIFGGVALWAWVGDLKVIVKGINDILDRLGIVGAKAAGAPGGASPAGTDWPATVHNLEKIVKPLTDLFEAANSGPQEAGKKTAPSTDADARQWGDQLATMLKATTATLTSLDQVVKSLTAFVPILIGALATLLVRLDDIKFAILDLLQFSLRVALLLRGAALVTIYDTISAVAKLGASILGILKEAFKTILDSVLAMIGSIFNVLRAFIEFIGAGLEAAMNALLTWLVSGLGRVLRELGNLRIFQLLGNLVDVLPKIVALIGLVKGDDSKMSPQDLKWLTDVKSKSLPGPTGAALDGKLPDDVKFPNVGREFLKELQPFKDSLKKLTDTLPGATGTAFDGAMGAMVKIDKTMQDALTNGEATFNARMTKDLGKVSTDASRLTAPLVPARTDDKTGTRGGGDAGLQAIAKAYAAWLEGGGMTTAVSQITNYFAGGSAANPAGAAAIPAGAVGTAIADSPKATVEIGELVIELKAARSVPGTKAGPGRLPSLPGGLPAGYDEHPHRSGG